MIERDGFGFGASAAAIVLLSIVAAPSRDVSIGTSDEPPPVFPAAVGARPAIVDGTALALKEADDALLADVPFLGSIKGVVFHPLDGAVPFPIDDERLPYDAVISAGGKSETTDRGRRRVVFGKPSLDDRHPYWRVAIPDVGSDDPSRDERVRAMFAAARRKFGEVHFAFELPGSTEPAPRGFDAERLTPRAGKGGR